MLSFFRTLMPVNGPLICPLILFQQLSIHHRSESHQRGSEGQGQGSEGQVPGSEGQVPDPLCGPPCLCATMAHINTRDIVQIRRRPSMSRTTRPMGLAR